MSRLLDEVGLDAEGGQLRKFSKGIKCSAWRVAQTLIDDPQVVIFDEPMSGLDPLGRRGVGCPRLVADASTAPRACSSARSILSGRQTLCSRTVAIVAKGRAASRSPEVRDGAAQGLEIILEQPAAAAVGRPSRRARAVTTIAPGRYAVDALPAEDPLHAQELAAGPVPR